MQILELPKLNGEAFALMIVRLEEHFIEYDFQSLSLMEYAIGNMVEEIFGERFELWHTKDAHDYLVFVVKGRDQASAPEQTQTFERAASQLQTAVKKLF